MPNNQTIPAELAEIIDIHKALFKGFTMMADDGAADGANPPASEGADTANPPAAEPGEDEPLKEPGLKALQAERDARAKAESDLAELRKQIEDANKTAEQKAADALKAAEATAAQNAAKALRYEVAAEKGLDLKLASRLTGTTKAEMEADADALKELVGAAIKPAAPRPDPSAGQSGDPKPKSLAEAIGQHYTS